MEQLQGLIDEIVDFQRKTFPTSNAVSKLHHLEKEVPELIDELNLFKDGGGSINNVRMEYADCFLLLFGSVALAGFNAEDIQELIREKIEINKRENGDLLMHKE